MKTTEEIIKSFDYICFCGRENDGAFVPKNNMEISRVKKWYSEEEVHDKIIKIVKNLNEENIAALILDNLLKTAKNKKLKNKE